MAIGGILDVKFTEIMYNPTDEGSTLSPNLEFIELKNTGASPVVMDGISIEGAISYFSKHLYSKGTYNNIYV